MKIVIDKAGIEHLVEAVRWTPTTPVPEVLERRQDSPDLERLLHTFADGLEELVAFGTHVFNWGNSSVKGGDEWAPIMFLFRHILEMADSISVLLRQSCIDSCELPLRAIFESSLGLRYMLADPDPSKNRAMAYLVSYAQERLKNYQRLDPTTEHGKQFAEALENEDRLDIHLFENPGLKGAIANLKELLEKPSYAAVNREFLRTRRLRKSAFPWYAMYNGPRNLADLSRVMEERTAYEVIYRHWSGRMHGTSIIQGRLDPGAAGSGGIVQLRFVEGAQEVTQWTCNLCLPAFQRFAEECAKNRMGDYREWYMKFRPFFLTLVNRRALTVSRDLPPADN